MLFDQAFSFSDIVDMANDAIMVTSAFELSEPGPVIVYVNDAFTRMSGYRADEVVGRSPRFLQGPKTDPDTKQKIREALEANRSVKARLLNYGKYGRQYWVDMNIVPLTNAAGDVTHYASVERDVTADVKREEELKSLATSDELTGSNNRRHFFERAELEIHRLKRNNEPFSVMLMDLDKFKAINDTYGHQAGDEVLIEAVQRWTQGLRPFDCLGRLGGEEFAILLPGARAESLMTIAERHRRVMKDTPIQTIKGPLSVTVSIGITTALASDESLKDTLSRADEALYASKDEGRDRVTIAA